MLKKWIIVAGCGLCSVVAFAQNTPSAAKVVVYKWSQNGVTHYSTHPPRGVGKVVKLDEQGLVIRDDSENLAIFEAMRPVRPAQQTDDSTSEKSNQGSSDNALPEGAISKSERCETARTEIETIENASPDQPINVEDADGNLIPMTDAEKKSRLENARALVTRLCND